MGRNRFVQPTDGTKIELSDGDWIRLKDRLTYGERQRVATAGLRKMTPAEGMADIGMEWPAFNLAKIETWLIDWSFTDATDKRVRISRDSIASLDPDTADEIMAAIDGHIAALEEEKKATSGASNGTATSPS